MHLNPKSRIQSDYPHWGLEHPVFYWIYRIKILLWFVILLPLWSCTICLKVTIFSTIPTCYVWFVWKNFKVLWFWSTFFFWSFDLLLPLGSTLRAPPDESSVSRLQILSLRTASHISSNFSFLDSRELLIAATTISHDSGNDDIKINALISFLKLMSTELNWLTIILNSFIWSATDPPSDICRLNNLRIKYHLFITDDFL